MKTIDVFGLNEKKTIECFVRVLGNHRICDPMVSGNVPIIEYLSAVSPNGEWLALDRVEKGSRKDLITITRVEEGAEEIVVPMDFDWENSRIRDISNDGTLLFQVELDRGFSNYGHSRRPLLFKYGDKKPLILPPPYDKEDMSFFRSPSEGNCQTAHTPYCYTSEGKIFGWSRRRYDDRQYLNLNGTDYFVYEQKKPGVWVVEYLPDSLDGKWIWTAYHNTFVWADQRSKDNIIRFGLFDGKSCSNFDIAVYGYNPQVVEVASNNTFICHYGVKGKRKYKNKEMHDYYALLAKPQDNALNLFKDGEENPWCEKLSPNGKYVIGSHTTVGWFILKSESDGYSYRVLNTPGWRIESLASVMDDGRIYAVATCVERKHGYFRLKLPVLLVPKW